MSVEQQWQTFRYVIDRFRDVAQEIVQDGLSLRSAAQDADIGIAAEYSGERLVVFDHHSVAFVQGIDEEFELFNCQLLDNVD